MLHYVRYVRDLNGFVLVSVYCRMCPSQVHELTERMSGMEEAFIQNNASLGEQLILRTELQQLQSELQSELAD